MSNKILIKSGNGAPANGVLDTAELGFDKTNNKLYIGNNGSIIDLTGINSATTADRIVNNWVTGSVLDFALSCPEGLTNFVTSTDTTDLPTWSNNYCYGTGLVMKRTNAFCYVELHPYNVKHNPIARNSYNNGDWYGWTYDYSEANKPTASDVGAAPAGHTHTATQVGALPVNGNAATASRVLVHNCSNTDFNTLTEAGLYQGYTGMTNANWPNLISVLEVIPYSYDWIMQRQTLINGDGQTAIRFKHSGTTWSPWKVMLSTSGGTMTGGINMGGYGVTNIGWPSVNTDAACKGYVDSYAANYLPLGGGTMTGYLNMNYNNITTLGWPEGDRDATPRKYVTDLLAGKLSLSGGTMTGSINMGWYSIYNIGKLKFTSDSYGTSLPAAGEAGRIFFKKVSG